MPSGLDPCLPIKNELIEGGFDILCVRELTGGLYFGQPRFREQEGDDEVVVDTMRYHKSEMVRIAKVAFEAARGRRKRVTSVDKANVLTNSLLWRETMIEVSGIIPTWNCCICTWTMPPCSWCAIPASSTCW